MQRISKSKAPILLAFLLFSSLGFGGFFIDIGFALKPYMIAVGLITLYTLFSLRKDILSVVRPFAYEFFYVLFLLTVALSYWWSLYPNQTLRFTVGAALLASSYAILRLFFTNLISYRDIIRSISWSGAVIALSSLTYYIAGVIAVGFVFNGNGITEMGLMIDRGVPRLIGTVATDPNLAAIFLAFPLIFFAIRKERYIIQLLLFFALLLTFSRGAYIAIGITALMYFILNIRFLMSKVSLRRLGVSLMMIVVLMATLGLISAVLGLSVVDIANERFSGVSTDGGSGRMDLWGGAINTFADNPLVGIGANSSLQYNIEHHGSEHYVHNSYLEVLSELGIGGALIVIGLICTTAWRARYCSRHGEGFLQYYLLTIALMAVFLSAMVHEMIMISLVLLATTSYMIDETSEGIGR